MTVGEHLERIPELLFVMFAQSISIVFTINFAGDALQRERVMNVCFIKIIRTFEATTIRQPRIMLIDQLRYGSNSCFAANYSVYNQESTKNVRGEHSFELFLMVEFRIICPVT